MKFTDGYWHTRAGITPHFPIHVHDIEIEPDALTVYGATKRLNTRGDTLNLPLLTARFSSPMPNVIRVKITHHKGRRQKQPGFELHAQPAPAVVIHNDAQAATLTSGRLSVRVEQAGDWQIEFMDGERVITSSGWRGMGIIETPQERYIHEQLALSGAAGTTFEVRRAGPLVHVQAHGATKPWRVLLRGVGAIQSVAGAAAADDALGTLLTPEPGASGLSVQLA